MTLKIFINLVENGDIHVCVCFAVAIHPVVISKNLLPHE